MKYAVVTGGTRGIGRAITERLIEEGYSVIAIYASDDVSAKELTNVYDAERLMLIKASLFDFKSACEIAQQIQMLCSNIDILVLNSATTDFTPFIEITQEQWKRVMDVNLNGPFFLIQKLAPFVTKQKGRIIMLGSYVGLYPHARSVSYGVSKAAIHALTRYLVKYFSPDGITVNCIAPGTIDTSWHDSKTPEHRKRIEDKIALHRFGKPEEIAELCMCIIHNQYINGSILNIDGGYSFE